MGTSALGKDIQDQAGAIQHPAFDYPFQVALLGRTQGMIEQHHIRFDLADQCGQLVALAGADEQGRIGSIALAGELRRRLHAAGGNQMVELIQVFAPHGVREVQMHQNGTFTGAGSGLLCAIK